MQGFYQLDQSDSQACVKQDTITLSDCLACSGCITSSEIQNFAVDTSFLEEKEPKYSFILSLQSKLNLKGFYPDIGYDVFEKCLINFLKEEYKIHMIVDISYFNKEQKGIISSECPAVVLYVERIFPELIPELSTSKTYQQIAASFIQRTENNGNHKIISVMQCYDKKDEIKRDGTKIDHFIGTREFYEFLKPRFKPSPIIEYVPFPWEISYRQSIQEISGPEACMNLFNKLKNKKMEDNNGRDEYLELRMCRKGCMNGPAQMKIETDRYENIELESHTKRVLFHTGERSFVKPKKKTFKIEW
ncbi:Cytosolic Fe-S cluster assembly factor nar1 [Glugoides intestinalis]